MWPSCPSHMWKDDQYLNWPRNTPNGYIHPVNFVLCIGRNNLYREGAVPIETNSDRKFPWHRRGSSKEASAQRATSERLLVRRLSNSTGAGVKTIARHST
jgi:hypothetical protein